MVYPFFHFFILYLKIKSIMVLSSSIGMFLRATYMTAASTALLSTSCTPTTRKLGNKFNQIEEPSWWENIWSCIDKRWICRFWETIKKCWKEISCLRVVLYFLEVTTWVGVIKATKILFNLGYLFRIKENYHVVKATLSY